MKPNFRTYSLQRQGYATEFVDAYEVSFTNTHVVFLDESRRTLEAYKADEVEEVIWVDR